MVTVDDFTNDEQPHAESGVGMLMGHRFRGGQLDQRVENRVQRIDGDGRPYVGDPQDDLRG